MSEEESTAEFGTILLQIEWNRVIACQEWRQEQTAMRAQKGRLPVILIIKQPWIRFKVLSVVLFQFGTLDDRSQCTYVYG